MASEHINIATPTDALPPNELDDEFRTIKVGLQDYLDANHYCTLGGNLFPTVASGGGQHRKVTFYSVIAEPTVAAGKVDLYTKTADGAPELHYKTNADAERQLTLNGAINLVEADFATVNAGATSILSFDAGELTLELDGTTIEYDAVFKLKIKVPVAIDANVGIPPVIYDGEYDGTGVDNAIELAAGVVVREVTIFNITTADVTSVQLLKTAVGETAKSLANGTTRTDLVSSVGGFTVSGTTSTLNQLGQTYRYIAHCRRP